MKKLLISASIFVLVACNSNSKSDVPQNPIDPRDTSTLIACDSVTKTVFDENGKEIQKKSFACDSHYVTKELEAEYKRQMKAAGKSIE